MQPARTAAAWSVVARGGAVADGKATDLGPVRFGDGPGVWAALRVLWRSRTGAPLADPAAALTAARGVAG